VPALLRIVFRRYLNQRLLPSGMVALLSSHVCVTTIRLRFAALNHSTTRFCLSPDIPMIEQLPQVVSPSEFSINSDQQTPLGSMLSKKRLLEAAKWQVHYLFTVVWRRRGGGSRVNCDVACTHSFT